MKKRLFSLISLALLALLFGACNKGEPVDIVPTPTPPDGPQITTAPTPSDRPNIYDEKIADAKAKNPDTIGWIQVPGTNIDYPIMGPKLYEIQRDGKKVKTYFYNDHDFDGKQVESGSVYTYFDTITQNIVVTAHNSRPSGTMFHQLHHVYEFNKGLKKCSYSKSTEQPFPDTLIDFKKPEDGIITVAFAGEEHQYQIFSVFQTEPGVDIKKTLYDWIWWNGGTQAKYEDLAVEHWLNTILDHSEFDFGVDVTKEDNFLSIITCGTEKKDSDKNSRLYYFLKRID